MAIHPNHKPHPRYEQPSFRLGFARLVTHYWRHNGWLADGILMRKVNCLSDVPSLLIHGRLDLCSPLVTPWRLAQNWPGSELIIFSEAGHDARDLAMSKSIVAATDHFARRR